VFGDGALTFREFVTREPLLLSRIQDAILAFLRDRNDAVLFGAQAVNAYVDEPRMTQDVDILSTRAAALGEELRSHLAHRFHVAVRLRDLGGQRGHRLFQVQKPRNRHLADIRPVDKMPASQRIGGILVLSPADLIASKVIAYQARRGQPKSGTDWRDLAVLLLAFPELKREVGLVADSLHASHAEPAVIAEWRELVAQDLRPAEEDEE
jgi:Nucleotidyl transferase AbiEii toxin, Type IV TA system